MHTAATMMSPGATLKVHSDYNQVRGGVGR